MRTSEIALVKKKMHLLFFIIVALVLVSCLGDNDTDADTKAKVATTKTLTLKQAQRKAGRHLVNSPSMCEKLFGPTDFAFSSGRQELYNGKYILRGRCHDDAYLVVMDAKTGEVEYADTCKEAMYKFKRESCYDARGDDKVDPNAPKETVAGNIRVVRDNKHGQTYKSKVGGTCVGEMGDDETTGLMSCGKSLDNKGRRTFLIKDSMNQHKLHVYQDEGDLTLQVIYGRAVVDDLYTSELDGEFRHDGGEWMVFPGSCSIEESDYLVHCVVDAGARNGFLSGLKRASAIEFRMSGKWPMEIPLRGSMVALDYVNLNI